jgi:hypothetical protein
VLSHFGFTAKQGTHDHGLEMAAVACHLDVIAL